MRLSILFCLPLALAGISAAQDTNFPTGPQYLITSNSPLFLHSIATPSLSLSAPLPSPAIPASEAPATEAPAAPEASSPAAGLPPQSDLARIYWGGPPPAAKVAETPAEQPAETPAEQPAEKVSDIQITSAPPPSALPASILPAGTLDVGVTGMTTVQSLRERGYGVPLGDTAAFWKAHKPHASRLYTNADLQRLHQS